VSDRIGSGGVQVSDNVEKRFKTGDDNDDHLFTAGTKILARNVFNIIFIATLVNS
jgi:hypothetical protein